MRPYKHVAPVEHVGVPARYQNVLGIELARFAAPWGEVPLVATTELERITLFAWNDGQPQWDDFERPHLPLTTEADAPLGPNGWNWSRRVSIVCARDSVLLVYKRARLIDDLVAVHVTVDRFEPDGGRLRFIEAIDLPGLPSNTVNVGFSLWAEYDRKSDRLLLLVPLAEEEIIGPRPGPGPVPRPGFGFGGGLGPRPWNLVLLTLPLDGLTDLARRTRTELGPGGFDLDARLTDGRLLVVHRADAASERFGPPIAQPIGITSGPEADDLYPPISLVNMDLGSLKFTTENLPGGAHPQIQSVDPLIITFDRQQGTVVRREPMIPLPPQQPRIVWEPTRLDKIAWIRRDRVDSRGVILSADATALPRALTAFASAMHLLQRGDAGFAHASPLPIFPVQLIGLALETKNIVLDILHHQEFLALLRTRLRIQVADGAVLVDGRGFEVWDIGHTQIGPSDERRPSTDPENRQFEPLAPLAATASEIGLVRAWRVDNTMGGVVMADLKGAPRGFFAYTNLGDGGLRVIFDARTEALPEPPPVVDEKTLAPESVTGPRLASEQWIELQAADFIDTDLVRYLVGTINAGKSLGGAVEVAVDSLLDLIAIVNEGGLTPGGIPIDSLQGMTEAQLAAADEFVADAALQVEPIQMTLSDGRVVDIAVSTAALIQGQPIEFTASFEATELAPVLWTFVGEIPDVTLPEGPLHPTDLQNLALNDDNLPTLPPVPLPPQVLASFVIGSFTNPTTVAFREPGAWRLSLFLPAPGAAGRPPGGAELLEVAPAASELLWTMHAQLNNEELEEFGEIGDLDVSFLGYGLHFDVDDVGERLTAAIATQPRRSTVMQFIDGGVGQGSIDLQVKFTVATSDFRLRGPLAIVFNVDVVRVEFFYGRLLTPGMLSDDQRALDPLRGEDLGDEPTHTIPRRDPRQHAAIAAKPVGDSAIPRSTVEVGITATPEAMVLSILVPALILMGATAILGVVLGLAGLGALIAAAGPGAIVAAAVVAVVLAVLVYQVIPLFAKQQVADAINHQLGSADMLETLDDIAILRYGGEGLAEAIARKVLARAAELGISVTEPAAGEAAGFDRLRGQVFQIVFVTDGVCRVLIRAEE